MSTEFDRDAFVSALESLLDKFDVRVMFNEGVADVWFGGGAASEHVGELSHLADGDGSTLELVLDAELDDDDDDDDDEEFEDDDFQDDFEPDGAPHEPDPGDGPSGYTP